MKPNILLSSAATLILLAGIAGGQARASARANLVPTILGPSRTTQIAAVGVCAQPNIPAKIAEMPNYETPAIAKGQGVTGTAKIQVDLTADNYLQGSRMLSTSGNPYLDTAAMEVANHLHYVSEVQNCGTVAGSYILSVEFD
jgi:TonB family protein